MKRPQKTIVLIFISLLVVAASFVSGAYFGFEARPEHDKIANILGKTSPETEKVNFEPFWKAWRILEEKHVGEEKIDREQLVWGAIEGMVQSLGDPYTTFFPPKDLEDFNSEIKGEFSGIGAEIGIRKDVLTVIAPIKGSPAERAGLRAGDKILKIDDMITGELTLDEAVHRIRGERKTKVTLTILRSTEDKPRIVEVIRDLIEIPIITTERKENSIFVIKLSSFSERSSTEFARAVREMILRGDKKLILDLRNNPGGFFNSAVEIASWFLPEGEVVAREEFQDREPDIYRSRGYRLLEATPTVILINRGSASASEILAGALQESKHAVLIGEKTFGKGTVQELQEITPETSLKITIAKWLTPSGKSISKEGLAPDIEVATPDDIESGQDPQLAKAIEYLKNK